MLRLACKVPSWLKYCATDILLPFRVTNVVCCVFLVSSRLVKFKLCVVVNEHECDTCNLQSAFHDFDTCKLDALLYLPNSFFFFFFFGEGHHFFSSEPEVSCLKLCRMITVTSMEQYTFYQFRLIKYEGLSSTGEMS